MDEFSGIDLNALRLCEDGLSSLRDAARVAAEAALGLLEVRDAALMNEGVLGAVIVAAGAATPLGRQCETRADRGIPLMAGAARHRGVAFLGV